jgi:hypothetical protein
MAPEQTGPFIASPLEAASGKHVLPFRIEPVSCLCALRTLASAISVSGDQAPPFWPADKPDPPISFEVRDSVHWSGLGGRSPAAPTMSAAQMKGPQSKREAQMIECMTCGPSADDAAQPVVERNLGLRNEAQPNRAARSKPPLKAQTHRSRAQGRDLLTFG